MTRTPTVDPAVLIGSFYDAALDDSLWSNAIQQCASALRADCGLLYCLDFADRSAVREDRSASLATFWGFAPSAMRSFSEHYTYVNVWQTNEHLLGEGAAVTSSMLYPDAQLMNTEFGSDWLRPQNLFYALGGVARKADTLASKVSFLRSRGAGEFDGDECRLWQSLVGHLNRALRLRERALLTHGVGVDALAALDLIPQGVVLLSAKGVVVHRNRRAEAFVGRDRPLFIDAGGWLRARSAASDASLQRLRLSATLTASGRDPYTPGGGSLRVERIGGGLHLFVCGLPAKSERINLGGVHAAVFVTDPSARPRGLEGMLRALYGMTPAESRLAAALASGDTLAEYAGRHSISVNTARVQLQAAMAKAGVRRQADLVRVALVGSAGLMH